MYGRRHPAGACAGPRGRRGQQAGRGQHAYVGRGWRMRDRCRAGVVRPEGDSARANRLTGRAAYFAETEEDEVLYDGPAPR